MERLTLPRPALRRYRLMMKIDVHHTRRFIRAGDRMRFVECTPTTTRYEKGSLLELTPHIGYDWTGVDAMLYFDTRGWAFSEASLNEFVKRRVLTHA